MTATKVKTATTAEDIVRVAIDREYDSQVVLLIDVRRGERVAKLQLWSHEVTGDLRSAVTAWCRSHLAGRDLLLATADLRRDEMPVSGEIGGTEARLAVAFGGNYVERSRADDTTLASQAIRDLKDGGPTRNVWDDETGGYVFSILLPDGTPTRDFRAAAEAWAAVRETSYATGSGRATTYAFRTR